MSLPQLPGHVPTDDVVADKARWRSMVRAARRDLVDSWSPGDRARAAEALGAAGMREVQRYAAAHRGGEVAGACVTAFEPLRTEPPVDGLTAQLLDAGVRVLVPITLEKPRLDWADLADPDRTPLGEAALAQVDVAFVPGLAVSRAGVRLGQGGGYYDSVLPRLRARSGGAPVVIVLHDHEVVEQVPADEHDAVVDAVLRPAPGLCRVPLG